MSALVRSYGCGNCRLEALSEVLKLWRHSINDHGNFVSTWLYRFNVWNWGQDVSQTGKHCALYHTFSVSYLRSKIVESISPAPKHSLCVATMCRSLPPSAGCKFNLERKGTLEGKDTWLVFIILFTQQKSRFVPFRWLLLFFQTFRSKLRLGRAIFVSH